MRYIESAVVVQGDDHGRSDVDEGSNLNDGGVTRYKRVTWLSLKLHGRNDVGEVPAILKALKDVVDVEMRRSNLKRRMLGDKSGGQQGSSPSSVKSYLPYRKRVVQI